MIGTAGQTGKGRAVQVIAKIGQKRLCKFTVVRQKSCQPQKKIKQNQRLADCSSLSSVDWAAAYPGASALATGPLFSLAASVVFLLEDFTSQPVANAHFENTDPKAVAPVVTFEDYGGADIVISTTRQLLDQLKGQVGPNQGIIASRKCRQRKVGKKRLLATSKRVAARGCSAAPFHQNHAQNSRQTNA